MIPVCCAGLTTSLTNQNLKVKGVNTMAKGTISVRVRLADGRDVAVSVRPQETLAQLREKALRAFFPSGQLPVYGLAIDGQIVTRLGQTVREAGLTGREEEEVRLIQEQVSSGCGLTR